MKLLLFLFKRIVDKMFWYLIGAIVVILIVWSFAKPYDYWSSSNVPQEKPLPIFGNQLKTLTNPTPLAEYVEYIYKMFPDWRYSGFYQFSTPLLVIRDPELIKQLAVKDFDHFMDHRTFISEDVEPLWSKNLFSLKGERWRHMRATLSPSFTSSKMKTMYLLMSECAENFVKYFDSQILNDEALEVEMKDALTRFTNDVIATTAFGIKCDSLGERDNKFYTMGKEVTDSSGFWKIIKIILITLTPSLARIFNLTFFSGEMSKFFSNVVAETIRVREENNIVRPDMINILMEARKGNKAKQEETPSIDTGFATVEEHIKPVDDKKTELTDTDITAQALLFFFAGFDSVATLMTFTSYELAVNPDVQERLLQEVDETYEACNGKITYEALMKMKYLDMVLSESLRKWPSAIVMDRVCVKPYTIQPVRDYEKPVHLKVDDALWIPVFAIHRDEKYYPDPERFDPERFNDDNKSNINAYNYMPFGVGPRNCIGSRFALLETKILFFHILRKFTLVPIDKTQIPLKLSKEQFILICEKGHWLGMKRRTV